MAEKPEKQSLAPVHEATAQTANPAELARRELVAWCEQHQLPVPDEHRPQDPQSNGR